MLYGASSVEAKSMSVGEVISDRYPMQVPRYQRSYAWDEEAVNYFVRDIEAMLDSPVGETSHFFGGVVCIRTDDNQRSHPTSYEVVDGQQRLATLMLALSCVVQVARELEETADTAASAKVLREETENQYIYWNDSDVAAGKVTSRLRLALALVDDITFQALVNCSAVPTPTRDSHRLLSEARTALLTLVRSRLEGIQDGRERVARLQRIQQALTRDAHLIHIVSKERKQAYRLFSVLNHRGESLSDADLLRSRSMELLEGQPEHQEAAAKVWDEILARPAKDIESFFEALYPSRLGERAHGDLYDQLQKAFLPADSPDDVEGAEQVVETIRGFRDELSTFLQITNGQWPFERAAGVPSQVRAWQIDRLRRLMTVLRHELAVPILLAAASAVDERTFAELCYMLEVFAFRYKVICGGHATKPANVYYRHAKSMRDAKAAETAYSSTALRAELREMISDRAGDDLFRQQLSAKLRYSNGSQRQNIKEFLTVLEDHHQWWEKTGKTQTNALPKPSMSKVIDLDDATLEHIYPQNAKTTERVEALEDVKHQLGNLTFFGAGDNVAAGNKSFAGKREIHYAPSVIDITADLAAHEAWALEDVEKREVALLDQAVRVFVI